MTGSGVGQATALARHQRDRAVLAVVLLLIFGFSYSADVVAWFLEFIGIETSLAWVIGLVGVDVAILLAAGGFKRVIDRAEGGQSRLWRPWWVWFGVVAALNATIACLPDHHPLWIDLLSGWHEYVTFILSVPGVFTGLVTVNWLLVASTPD